MKQVLTITSDDSLVDGLEEAANLDGVGFQKAPDWPDASDRLVEATFEAVCIDYTAIQTAGLDAFVQLDNILRKEQTDALLLLRDPSEQARQFGETLGSLVATINLRKDPASRFRSALKEVLDQREDPDDAPGSPTQSDSREIELPHIDRGSLDRISVARLVHTIARRGSTGVLELSTGDMDRRFAFRDGDLAAPVDVNTSSTKNLEAAFAWSGGNFSFTPKERVDGETSAPYAILLRGALNHLDQRGAMGALTSEMSKYVAATSLWENRPNALGGFEGLEMFVGACHGETTLEQVLSSVASRALKGFQSAFFAVECDLVVLTDEPTDNPVTVEFAGEATVPADAGTGDDVPSSRGDDVEEPSTAEREKQLRDQHKQIENANAYEVLGLWEGCGEDAVRTRYFELVKTHHPDAYGGNISEEGKQMAEEIFIAIKEAHSELLRQEDEQTIPPSAATETDSDAADGLSNSLASPSVTAMGSGEQVDGGEQPGADDSSEATADSKTETGRDSSAETAVPNDPQTTKPPGAGDSDATTVDVQTDQSSARPAPGGEDDPDATIPPGGHSGPSRSDNATPLGDRASSEAASQGDEDRRQKLEQLKQRAPSNSPPTPSANDGGSRKDTGARQNKLDDLRKSDSSTTDQRIDNLETAETADEAQEYFNRGYKAYKNENNDQALECFEKAHEFDEDNSLYKTFYGYLQFLNDPDQKDEAQQLLKEALKSDNRQAQPDAHLFFGRILKVKDNHERARKHFERAVDLNPESIEAKRELRVYEMREKKGDSTTGEKQNAGETIKDFLDKDLF